MKKHIPFSSLSQADLDRQDAARSMRAVKAAITRVCDTARAKRDAQNDLDRLLFLGERSNRDLWTPGSTRTYRKTYRKEMIRLTTHP